MNVVLIKRFEFWTVLLMVFIIMGCVVVVQLCQEIDTLEQKNNSLDNALSMANAKLSFLNRKINALETNLEYQVLFMKKGEGDATLTESGSSWGNVE